MNKKFLLIFTVIAVLVVSSIVLFFDSGEIKNFGFYGNGETGQDTESFSDNEGFENNLGNDAGFSRGIDSEDGSGSGGGSGISEGEESESSFSSGEEDEIVQEGTPLCSIVRPGSLPDVECFINYIHADGVSIGLFNENQAVNGASVVIDNCSPELALSLPLSQKTDFVFSCNNQESYFQEEISITYLLEGQSEGSTIYGFVSGSVGS